MSARVALPPPSPDPGPCAICGAPGARWAQFPHGHCRACALCLVAGGGWREEDRSPARPLAVMFPRAGARVDDLL